jgi:hypothetical protein
VGGLDSQRLDPVLGDNIGIHRFYGLHLRERCCPCIIERFHFHLSVNFHYMNSNVSNSKLKLVII